MAVHEILFDPVMTVPHTRTEALFEDETMLHASDIPILDAAGSSRSHRPDYACEGRQRILLVINVHI